MHRMVLLLVLLILLLPTPTYADENGNPSPGANGRCGTSKVGPEDFVDPSGGLMSKKGFTVIKPNRSMIIVALKNSGPGVTPGFPESWKSNTSFTLSEMTLRENGTRNFGIVRFSSPIELCLFLIGWEEWQKNILTAQSSPETFEKNPSRAEEVLLVFERNGRLEALSSSVAIWLFPGIMPEDFKARVLKPMVKAGLLVENSGDKFSLDGKNGLWKITVKVPLGIFPLRVALRLAEYRDAGDGQAWITKVEPLFIPLVSIVRTITWMEKVFQGRNYRLADNEPALVEQYDLPGLRISVAVDLLLDKGGPGQLKLLSDEHEFGTRLSSSIYPGLNAEDVDFVDPGCTKRRVLSPDPSYVREVFSCFVSITPAGDFSVKKIQLRFEDLNSGKILELPNERELLIRVLALSHPDQDGINPFLPKTSSTSPVVEKKNPLPLQSIPEPTIVEKSGIERWTIYAEQFIKENVRAPMENIGKEFWSNPRVFLRTKVFNSFLILWTALALFVIIFFRWFGLPSVVNLLGRAFGLVVISAKIISLPFRFYRPYWGWRSYAAMVSGVKNPASLSLARRFGIIMPTDPSEFLSWIAQTDRSGLERAVGALWLEENMSRYDTSDLRAETITVRKSLRRQVSFKRFFLLPLDIIRLKREIKPRCG